MESPTERAIYTVRYAIAIMPVVQRGYNFEQASYMGSRSHRSGWR